MNTDWRVWNISDKVDYCLNVSTSWDQGDSSVIRILVMYTWRPGLFLDPPPPKKAGVLLILSLEVGGSWIQWIPETYWSGRPNLLGELQASERGTLSQKTKWAQLDETWDCPPASTHIHISAHLFAHTCTHPKVPTSLSRLYGESTFLRKLTWVWSYIF